MSLKLVTAIGTNGVSYSVLVPTGGIKFQSDGFFWDSSIVGKSQNIHY